MRVLRFRLEEGATGTCSHAHSARAPALTHRVLLQDMFYGSVFNALSECNKIAIHNSFKTNSYWPYSWGHMSCHN